MNKRLIAEGIQNPGKAIRHLYARLQGNRRLWKEQDGTIVFQPGGHAGHADNRPEFAASTYREGNWLNEVIESRYEDPTVLEIGAGYGRLTPFIENAAKELIALEPSAETASLLKRFYEDIEVLTTTADDIQLSSNSVDVVVSWTVLMHIPPESIDENIKELSRVLVDTGEIIQCEARTESVSNVWGRSPETYAELIDGEVVDTFERPLPSSMEPTDADVAILQI